MTRARDWEENIFSSVSQTAREEFRPTKEGTRVSKMVDMRTLKRS
jgi:hypothetical protein